MCSKLHRKTAFETIQQVVIRNCTFGQNENGTQPVPRRFVDRDWYVVAANWLGRSDIMLGLEEQLQLDGFYPQARDGRRRPRSYTSQGDGIYYRVVGSS